jgi:hypothetical protein
MLLNALHHQELLAKQMPRSLHFMGGTCLCFRIVEFCFICFQTETLAFAESFRGFHWCLYKHTEDHNFPEMTSLFIIFHQAAHEELSFITEQQALPH